MHVVYVLRSDEGMQWRIDGRGARVEIKRAMGIAAHHAIFGFGLGAARIHGRIDRLQTEELLLIERREVGEIAGSQIAARALYPEHHDRFAGERIALIDFRRRVASAGIGNALIGPEQVGTIYELLGWTEGRGLRIVPEVVHVFQLNTGG